MAESKTSGSRTWAFGAAGGALVAIALGTALYGAPPGPDVPQGLARIVGAFLLFLFYGLAQWGWGHLIRRKIGHPFSLWENFFWGSMLLAMALTLVGLAGGVGAGSAGLWRAFLIAGPLGAAFWERKAPEANGPASARVPWLLFLAFVPAFVGAAYPHSFWDSLWYHLPAGRFWCEQGAIVPTAAMPTLLLTGLWDSHFLLGQILLGSLGEGGGLIPAHLFGQWAALSTVVFSALVLFENRKRFTLSAGAIFIGLIFCELFESAEFAKNDWAACFWSLAALAFFLRKNHPAWIGLAMGCAFAAKFNAVFFLLPLGLLAIRRRPGNFVWLALSFAVACAPVLGRNFAFTGNPFFPWAGSLFPSPLLGPSFQLTSDYQSTTWAPIPLMLKALALVLESLPLLGLMAWPFTKQPVRWLAPAALSLLLFLFFSGPKAEGRLLGAALLLLAGYGVGCLETCVARFAPKARIPALLGVAAALLFCAGRGRFVAHDPFAQDPAVAIRSAVGGSGAAWLRMHAQPGEGVATLSELRLYYLLPVHGIRAFDEAELDRELFIGKGVPDRIAALRKRGIRYLLLTGETLDRYYDRPTCDLFFQLAEAHPEAVPFKGDLSRVLDLTKLP